MLKRFAKLSQPKPAPESLASAAYPPSPVPPSSVKLGECNTATEQIIESEVTSDFEARDSKCIIANACNNKLDGRNEQSPATADSRDSLKKQSINEERNAKILPMKKNPLYNVAVVHQKLSEYPTMKICGEGKYYLNMKNEIFEEHEKIKRNKRGQVIPTIREEVLGPIESVFSRFCTDVLCISRAKTLPLTSQGERHLIWVGPMKAKHIINRLNGNGCYIVNRFPGGVFLKDKQVMGVTLRQFMLERKNHCLRKCGFNDDPFAASEEDDEDDEEEEKVTYKICSHMVKSMRTDSEACDDETCYNFGKKVCKHLDIFIPEVQSFGSYNALQDFSNRLSSDLKGQLFVCKPSYVYKGLGFRFFHRSEEFQTFYHMTIGKETSRHDFLVQRVVRNPYLFEGRKVDIRAFLLIATLRHRRVVAFVNPGFCRVASAQFVQFPEETSGENSEESNAPSEKPKSLRKRREVAAEELEERMQMLVCPYQTKKERADRAERMEKNLFFTDKEDRSKELDEVFRSEALLTQIKKQVNNIGMRLASSIENKIWDAYGCFQIFGFDLCVDENHKVWLLEVNSHAMSEVDLLSPTQRAVVPAVLMEALGLVVESMYKSSKGLRLRKSPLDEFKETGFLFAQNFSMVHSTLKRRRTNYLPPRRAPAKVIPFYERVTMVDDLIQRKNERKRIVEQVRRQLIAEKAEHRRRVNAKAEEES